jgi:hypothetical protein
MTSGAEIALFSGGWTAIVGLAGFGAAIYTNNRTISAAREDAVKDRRADAYIDVLKQAAWQQEQRQDMRQMLWQGTALPLTQPTSGPIDYDTIEARMQAFATTNAFTALQVHSIANGRAEDAFTAWVQTRSGEDKAAALSAFEKVDAARSALVEQIRDELNPDGTPLKNWTEPDGSE